MRIEPSDMRYHAGLGSALANEDECMGTCYQLVFTLTVRAKAAAHFIISIFCGFLNIWQLDLISYRLAYLIVSWTLTW